MLREKRKKRQPIKGMEWGGRFLLEKSLIQNVQGDWGELRGAGGEKGKITSKEDSGQSEAFMRQDKRKFLGQKKVPGVE